MLVHRAGGTPVVLDFFVAVPGRGLPAAAPELEPVDIRFGSGDTTQRFFIGPASCAVPGMVAGLTEAHRRYGSLPWRHLLAPARELARDGLELNADQAVLHEILDPILRYEQDGPYGSSRPLRHGERLALPDLGETIESIASDGAGDFYRGSLARRISDSVRRRGGRLTLEDLAAYRVVARRPVRVQYRSHDVLTNPPPSSGGILIAFALRILDTLGPGGPPGSAEALARMADVSREAAAARDAGFFRALRRGGLSRRLLGDDRVDAAVAEILGRRARAPARELAALPSTTHVSVLDERGNAASLSSSTGCGSGVVVPGTGIHLNNMLGESDLNPLGRGLAPGRRLTSMMAPSVLLRADRPRLVLGSAGSERLRGAILQTVVNTVDHGLATAEAVDRPRVHLDGADLHCEAGLDPAEVGRLESFGYRTVRWPGPGRNLFFGGVSAVAARDGAVLEAAGDPRRGGEGVVVR